MTAMKTKAATRNGSAADLVPDGPAAPMSAELAVVIPRIQPKIVEVEVVGLTPLLVCAWSEKAKREIEEKQTGKAHKKKAPRNPEEEYRAGLYVSTEGWTGVPAGGVKGCLVNACRAVDGLPMTIAKRMIFIRSQGRTAAGQQLVRIHGDHEMHSAMVRTSTGVAMPRYRPIYPKWSLRLEVEYLSNLITAEQVCNLIELAGFVEGLCEHRPGAPKSCTGDQGRFCIKRSD